MKRILAALLLAVGSLFAGDASDSQSVDAEHRLNFTGSGVSGQSGTTVTITGGSGGGTSVTNIVSLTPTSLVQGASLTIDTNAATLNFSGNVLSYSTNFVGPIILTGTNVETNAVTFVIPAGVIGSNGVVRMSVLWETRNKGATATAMRTRWGGGTATAAQLIESKTGTTSLSWHLARDLFAANSDTNFVTFANAQAYGANGGTAPTFVTNSSLLAIPVYFNVVGSTNVETNILWGAHLDVIYQK